MMTLIRKITNHVFWMASLLYFLMPQLTIAQPWVEIAKLTSSESASQDFLGGIGRADISGMYTIVGVPFKKDDTEENAGKAYIFELDTITDEWKEAAVLVAPNRMPDDAFGVSVAISGEYAVIGANADDEDASEENPLESAGSAYVFKRDANGSWSFMQKIVASQRKEFDRFGKGVDIDGSRIVVGATGNDFDANGEAFKSGAGAAFIYDLDDSDRWIEKAKIVASNRANLDQFGFPVVVCEDHLFIGSPRKDDSGIDEAGNVYVFVKDTNGVWTESQRIVSNHPSDKAQFGNSLSVSGLNAIIGEHKADTSTRESSLIEDGGLAHIYNLDTNGMWAYTQSLESSDRSEKDAFGSSVSISDDYAVIGAVGQNTDANGEQNKTNAGAAYVFSKNITGEWVQSQKIVASDREANAAFGSEACMDGDLMAIGSQLASAESVLFAGALFILELCDTKGSIEVTSCDSYTTPGGIELDSSGTYLDVIPNTAGCDSLITINLTILRSTSSSLDVSDCASYTVPSGDTTFFENGNYIDVIPNAVGCDSVITINITIWVVDTSVSQSANGDTLIANDMNARYQWYRCDLEEIIPEATARKFSPQTSGFFAVIITDMNDCVDTSSCYEYVSTGVSDFPSFPTNVSVFPNPSNSIFNIDLGTVYSGFQISLMNLNGQTVTRIEGGQSQYSRLDLSDFPGGAYFIKITSEGYAETVRIIKL